MFKLGPPGGKHRRGRRGKGRGGGEPPLPVSMGPPCELLNHISFELNGGDFLAISGSNSSGKTVLLKALLGFHVIKSGSLTIKGRISYASQSPFIMDTLIRENIIMGEVINVDGYVEAIAGSSLLTDLQKMEQGDRNTYWP